MTNAQDPKKVSGKDINYLIHTEVLHNTSRKKFQYSPRPWGGAYTRDLSVEQKMCFTRVLPNWWQLRDGTDSQLLIRYFTYTRFGDDSITKGPWKKQQNGYDSILAFRDHKTKVFVQYSGDLSFEDLELFNRDSFKRTLLKAAEDLPYEDYN